MKRILPLLLIGLACATAHAQEAKECFTHMPDSLSPLLSAVNRADCIDFVESGMKAEVTNRFGRKSEMTRLTSDYICMRMSDQSTWQMKLLATGDTTRIICTVSTVCATACDSDIRFYTTDWRELPASRYLPSLPVLTDFIREESDATVMENAVPSSDDAGFINSDEADFINKEDSISNRQRQLREADMLLMQADLSADDTTLVFTCTTPAYREKGVAETLSALLGKSVIYRWEAGIFQKE